jgi:hypothetical protein
MKGRITLGATVFRAVSETGTPAFLPSFSLAASTAIGFGFRMMLARP